ncbi:MAG: DeoR/GlpR transcriptional regulator [Selenomonadaceae bacterium]|nr:DeoR/GlpR transcriptional regulator [Selenomonadaceae bacterium]
MNTRQTKILDIMSNKKRVTVTELAEALGVSEVTTRKDLSQLEAKGLLKREHGYASLMGSDDVGNRLSINYDIKRRIAQKAMESVSDGETVMIESGSCCALLAEALLTHRRDITIVTNSVFIASYVRQQPNARIILLGGEMQNEAQVMVGPLVRKCVASFYVNKLFVGTDGFNEFGSMSRDLMRAEAVRDMAVNAKQAIILTESAKFYQTGVVPLFPYHDIDAIYTDNSVTDDIVANIRQHGIKIYTLSAETTAK